MFTVGAALSGWGRELHGYASDHGSDVEVVLVRDRRAALEPRIDVLAVDPALWVDPALVAAAGEAGIRVVGVYSVPAEEAKFRSWGVEHRIRSDVPAEHMLFLLDQLRPDVAERHVLAALDFDAGEVDSSRLVCGGPAGAGVVEVAIGIATRLAGDGPTVLVDLNECGGEVARRLGYEEHPNVVTALSSLDGGGDLTGVLAGRRGGTPVACDLIAGLPTSNEWTLVPPDAAARLVNRCEAVWRSTVVVTGPQVEDLRRWVDRYGVSRRMIATAARLVGVCEASPRGVLRFGEWLTAAAPQCVVDVVINKVPAGSRFAASDVWDELSSLCGDRVRLAGALPWDRRVMRAAWDGILPARGGFTRALDDVVTVLVDELVGVER